jgi:glucans biosynthesis protein C
MCAFHMSKTTTLSKTTTRHPSLDALRAAAMLYVVLWHAMLAYGPATKGRWSVLDPQANDAWSTIIWLTMGVSLRIFFVMAGFFAYMVYQREGLRDFVIVRAKRLGIPLVAGAYLFNLAFKGKFEYYPFHLWFLQHILLFSLVMPILAELRGAARLRFVQRASEAFERGFRNVMAGAFGPFVAAIPTALFLVGGEGAGRDPAALANDPFMVPSNVGYYAVFFGFGWLLFRSSELLVAFKERCRSFLAAGIVIRLATLVMLESPDLPLRTPLMVIATSLYTWLIVLGSIGLVQRLIHQDRPILRYIADASYFCYFAHPIFVIGLQMLLTKYQMPTVAKYALVVAGTLSALVFLYEFLVRYTPVGSLLNGPRRRPDAGRSAAWALRWEPEAESGKPEASKETLSPNAG